MNEKPIKKRGKSIKRKAKKPCSNQQENVNGISEGKSTSQGGIETQLGKAPGVTGGTQESLHDHSPREHPPISESSHESTARPDNSGQLGVVGSNESQTRSGDMVAEQVHSNGQGDSRSGGASKSHNTSAGVELTDDRLRILRDSLADPIRWTEWLFDCQLDEWSKDACRSFITGKRTARAVCNGGGKTKLFAGLGSWTIARFRNSKSIMTAGVFLQCLGVRDELMRVMHKLTGWTLNERELIHPTTGSRFIWFSADNPGYFEGHHADFVTVLIDESKSVPGGIYEASERLTANKKRFTFAASSTGGATGWFYECFSNKKEFWDAKQISAYDIPRIKGDWIEEQKQIFGEESPLFKSMILSEFINTSADTLIQLEWINRIKSAPPRWNAGMIVAGIDLSASADGDESVIMVRNGNKIIELIAWRDADPMRVAGKCITELNRLSVPRGNIFADSGGLGSGIVSRMQELGWPITGVQFGGSPLVKSERIQNRMTELWDNMARDIELQRIILPDDSVLTSQLTSRKCTTISSGRLKLETKQEMKKRGCKSPDRADALALALMIPYQSPRQRTQNANDASNYLDNKGSGDYSLAQSMNGGFVLGMD